MIHCYFGDYSSHQHELNMLNRFLSQLQLDWQEPDRWIYIIFNAMWNGEEIDLVCFTQHAIIVADLKSYSGQLKGSENGPWQMTTPQGDIEVKGGGQINPYVQIRKNKFSVINWIKQYQFFTQSQVDHVSAVVIFDEIEQCTLELPDKVLRWLSVSDIPHSSSDLAKLHSNDIDLQEQEVQALIAKLNLQPYQWQAGQITDIRFDPFTSHTTKTSLPMQANTTPHTPIPQPIGEPPKKWLHVYLPFLLTLLLAYAVGYSFQHKGLAAKDVLHKLPPFSSQVEDQEQINEAGTEQISIDDSDPGYLFTQSLTASVLPLGMSYPQVITKLKDFHSVSSALYSGKIIATNSLSQAPDEVKKTYLFFDTHNKLSGIRYVMEAQKNNTEQRYKEFEGMKEYFLSKDYRYLWGDQPFVGTQVAHFKHQSRNEYVQILQPHLSFDLHLSFMNGDLFEQYADKAAEDMRGNI